MNLSLIIYLVGLVLSVESLFFALPIITCLIYGEYSDAAIFLAVGLFSLTVGLLCRRKKPKRSLFYSREGFAGVAVVWIAISIFGALPFVLSGAIPHFIDALFEIVSGFTTTGSSILIDVEALNHGMLFWRSFSHWLGGMGVLVLLLALLPTGEGGFSMNLMRAESPGPVVGKLLPHVRQTAKFLYLTYLGLTVAEIVILMIGGMPVFDALCLSFGSAGTGGFGVKADSVGSYAPHLQAIIAVFVLLFGVNFNLYYYLYLRRFKQALSMEEVKMYFIIIIGATALICFNIAGLVVNFSTALLQAFFQVASIITTTGYASTDFNQWPDFAKTILWLLMFMGACAGSTGGGFKVARVMILGKSALRNIRQVIAPRSIKVVKVDGKEVSREVLDSTASYLTIYVLVFLASILLVSIDGKGMMSDISAVTATINNIGPGFDVVGPMGSFASYNYFAKLVFIFDMLAGRLELLPMLTLFAKGSWKR
ncbi:MAG: TrkH family potassium uptake protein [Erysipelotrichaceae bacterium]|jgi:trk system potassium uptake protein TrkH|nr:TrkH family potassium uptake protein [Erysipelotrichaceae bacterium]